MTNLKPLPAYVLKIFLHRFIKRYLKINKNYFRCSKDLITKTILDATKIKIFPRFTINDRIL